MKKRKLRQMQLADMVVTTPLVNKRGKYKPIQLEETENLISIKKIPSFL